ncbi:MAG: HDOD domain-containing protein [bacterium]|nr:HDOD domain-containing protein [bacterium]
MSHNQPAPAAGEEFGLIVEQGGVRPDLIRQLGLILNYFYGYNMMLARSPEEAAGMVAERGDAVAYVLILGDRPLAAVTVSRLTRNGTIPLVALLPQHLVDSHEALAREVAQLHLIAFETIPEHSGALLKAALAPIFEHNGIGGLWDRAEHVSFRILEQRVAKRVSHLHTLPTLPEVVMRILEVVNDDSSTSAQLEEVLHSDPAIVHKLMQVVSTAAFAGSGRQGEWGLRDAIVRLGRRKLGSLALQIKLINGLVKPEDSGFDLRRFWVHSVGVAHIADQLYSQRLVRVDADAVLVHEYWVAALLHDIGKLILGFFFWEHFQQLAALTSGGRMSFREAEQHLGDVVGHEQLGQLLLMRAAMNENLVRCVGTHHHPGSLPSELLALVHLADNLCKDLGMGALADETAQYDAAVLRVLGVSAERVIEIRDRLGPQTVQQVMDIVERCTAG